MAELAQRTQIRLEQLNLRKRRNRPFPAGPSEMVPKKPEVKSPGREPPTGPREVVDVGDAPAGKPLNQVAIVYARPGGMIKVVVTTGGGPVVVKPAHESTPAVRPTPSAPTREDKAVGHDGPKAGPNSSQQPSQHPQLQVAAPENNNNTVSAGGSATWRALELVASFALLLAVILLLSKNPAQLALEGPPSPDH